MTADGRVMGRCPECYATAAFDSILIDIRLMTDPPRQVEPHQKVTRWQCYSIESHHGERKEPAS